MSYGQLAGPKSADTDSYGGRWKFDNTGKAWIWVKAHANLTAKKPYQMMWNQYGPVTKDITDEAVYHYIVVPEEAVGSGEYAWMQVRGFIEKMICTAGNHTAGHAIKKHDATIVTTGAAPSGAASEFAVATEAGTSVTSIDCILFGDRILGTT